MSEPIPLLPPVQILADEYPYLADLVCGAPLATSGLALLWRELERATVTPPGRAPPDLARLGSRVTYTDLDRRETRTVRLVGPPDVLLPVRLPVTNPVGAALLGLRPGAVFVWPQEGDVLRRLRVDHVEQPLGPTVTPPRRAA